MIFNRLFKKICSFYSYIFSVLYSSPMVKWLIYKVTGKCELERICLARYVNVSTRTIAIDKCLSGSRNNELKCMIEQYVNDSNVDHQVADKLVIIKKIQTPDQKLLGILNCSLAHIKNYRNLLNHVEVQRKTQFSYENVEHVDLLKDLWYSLKQNNELNLNNLISKQWTEIGFQSNNPATDFRGMGLLGLINLAYFTTNEKIKSTAYTLYTHSLHPLYGYSFAIVGINITSWIHKWLVDGHLK